MITIPKKVEYSVVFIAYLSKNRQDVISLTEAAEKLNLPYRFLGQLAGKLKLAGLITSKEGKTGGYILSNDWENKSLYDLIEALGENKHLVKCLGSNVCARAEKCQMRGVWGRIESGFTTELKKIKLKEL
ncbi:MAG: Rrf2 family transcriptional regulator [Candidatus Shapirobacteria bacterium]|nr:Rrf2 family transcriptional regulator [Candidatus Shapirobacteria bacterium]